VSLPCTAITLFSPPAAPSHCFFCAASFLLVSLAAFFSMVLCNNDLFHLLLLPLQHGAACLFLRRHDAAHTVSTSVQRCCVTRRRAAANTAPLEEGLALPHTAATARHCLEELCHGACAHTLPPGRWRGTDGCAALCMGFAGRFAHVRRHPHITKRCCRFGVALCSATHLYWLRRRFREPQHRFCAPCAACGVARVLRALPVLCLYYYQQTY